MLSSDNQFLDSNDIGIEARSRHSGSSTDASSTRVSTQANDHQKIKIQFPSISQNPDDDLKQHLLERDSTFRK